MSPDTTGTSIASHAGAVSLLRTAEKVVLTSILSQALAPLRKHLAAHDHANLVLDGAMSLAIGGDCLATHNPSQC